MFRVYMGVLVLVGIILASGLVGYVIGRTKR
jgi:hypothetical protein